MFLVSTRTFPLISVSECTSRFYESNSSEAGCSRLLHVQGKGGWGGAGILFALDVDLANTCPSCQHSREKQKSVNYIRTTMYPDYILNLGYFIRNNAH